MNLSDLVRAAGVVGAGGGGFPTHVKLGSRVECVIANGAECEPLMKKDTEVMRLFPERVVAGLVAVMETTGAARGVIGVKAKHSEAVESLRKAAGGTGIEVRLLGDFYPMGDEFVLVHEITGRLIPPGGIPLNVGVVVQNVETLVNVAHAAEDVPVTSKFLTVSGAVRNPLSLQVPIGVSFSELIDAAGGASEKDFAIFVGGVMMGQLTRDPYTPVTKTTTGIVVLPSSHRLVERRGKPEEDMHRIGKSACDQCSYCTELCPRYLLGYNVQPHKVMRSLLFGTASTADPSPWSKWGLLCCGCELCTLYACPEGLYPKEACDRAKRSASRAGGQGNANDRGPGAGPHPLHGGRRVPVQQLVRRLGLAAYDREAGFAAITLAPTRVRLPLKQGAGAPALAVVAVGDVVRRGDLVADAPVGKLGARLHASIDGTVTETEPVIAIEAR